MQAGSAQPEEAFLPAPQVEARLALLRNWQAAVRQPALQACSPMREGTEVATTEVATTLSTPPKQEAEQAEVVREAGICVSVDVKL